jgi:cyclophilin family peptidyl-prolyl cis-trans isomerase
MTAARLVLCTMALAMFLLPRADAEDAEGLSKERLVVRTEAGDIVIRFFGKEAPQHTAQFLKLGRLGVFDTTHFVRLEPGFLAQISVAEDRLTPLTGEQQAAIHPMKAEWSNRKHVRGVVNVGRKDDDPDSGETSFCILLGDAPHLDGKYTIIGKVDELSLAVVEQMFRVPRNGTTPKIRLTVTSAFVIESDEGMTTFERIGPTRVMHLALPVSATVFRLIALILVAGLSGYLLGHMGRKTGVLIGQLIQVGLSIGVFACLLLPVQVSAESTPVPHWEAFPMSKQVAGIVVLIVIVSAISILLRRRLEARMQSSFNLLSVLLAGFTLFAICVPAAQASSVAAFGVFIGLMSIIKLMGNFESVT